MRDIKFRAWDNKNQRWLTHYQECYLSDHGDVIIEDTKIEDGSMRFVDAIAELYTGLSDKNGKDIYEGDILKTDEAGIDCGHAYAVEWCVSAMGCGWNIVPAFVLNEEIIGNIHENPELINQEVKA